ncbi:hypothetical protein P152DRAFT_25556 [Eremomyces bilateralis CBS 781.70]|uniref:Secreted protein n=1 Tax=Eremomyces bilateralis CBS 781.70 TaxID=1392243 RepID=A0A6G1GIB5_9PEZI|nr:uncharacterized protein P152DRAFT_25556 [Eremomyces bilateralis CBS 781.70]KAF1817641.1 hypothetical protein P152DRAFT_25556 [Eremomyces bilateralis CBS 781.70]
MYIFLFLSLSAATSHLQSPHSSKSLEILRNVASHQLRVLQETMQFSFRVFISIRKESAHWLYRYSRTTLEPEVLWCHVRRRPILSAVSTYSIIFRSLFLNNNEKVNDESSNRTRMKSILVSQNCFV